MKKPTGVVSIGGAIALAAAGILVSGCSRIGHGACFLNARAFAVGHDGGAFASTLNIQNDDTVDWQDVSVTVQGVGTGGKNSGEPTGGYGVHLALVDAGKGMAIKLGQLQKPDGSRWADMVMRATDITITAKMGGESCQWASTLKESTK